MHTINEMKSAVWVEIDIEIAFITTTLVKKVNGYVTSITTQFADVLEIGFD